jgi:hypothetical protein
VKGSNHSKLGTKSSRTFTQTTDRHISATHHHRIAFLSAFTPSLQAPATHPSSAQIKRALLTSCKANITRGNAS